MDVFFVEISRYRLIIQAVDQSDAISKLLDFLTEQALFDRESDPDILMRPITITRIRAKVWDIANSPHENAVKAFEGNTSHDA